MTAVPLSLVALLLSAGGDGQALIARRQMFQQTLAAVLRLPEGERSRTGGPIRDGGLEFPLESEQIARAQRARRAVRGLGEPPTRMSCAPGNVSLPIEIWFANYTLDEYGHPLPGASGWSAEERSRLSAFLCRALPLTRDAYGSAFEVWPITLVKDLYYQNSWIFIPATLEVHAGGTWNARLLLHECLHAFRGKYGLTGDADWAYDPTLSGFEEGFAEGLAYQIMNDYLHRYCPAGVCAAGEVPAGSYYTSWMDGAYDFANDATLTTRDFWSDLGGTLQYYVRYGMAALAFMRLETEHPGFSRHFNVAYYQRIRADAAYRPTRAGVIELFEAVAPTMEGVSMRDWIEAQRIFDCRTAAGKKSWLINYHVGWAVDEEGFGLLHTVETFPDGHEWYQLVPNCPIVPGGGGPYLYHRLQETETEVALLQAWNGAPVAAGKPRTYVAPGETGYRVRGCNDVVGAYGAAELHLLAPGQSCASYYWPEPVCFPRPQAWGLYALHSTWPNPQFGAAPGPPAYAMPYDPLQRDVEASFPVLAGLPPSGFDRWRDVLVGGVTGGLSGTLTITHSVRPGSLQVPVERGAFFAAPPRCQGPKDDGQCWARRYAPWSSDFVTVPGTLHFTFEPDDGSAGFEEERTIQFGFSSRHALLLGTR